MSKFPDLLEDLANGNPRAAGLVERSLDALPEFDEVPSTDGYPLGHIIKVRGEYYVLFPQGWLDHMPDI